MSMVKCRECGHSVSSRAKKCPICGLDQRSWFMRHKILSFFGILILLNIIASMGLNNNLLQTNSEISPELFKKEYFKVNDVISTNKFQIVVTSLDSRNIVGNQFWSKEPASGGVFVAVQWQYKNTSDKPIGAFSTPDITLIDLNGSEYSADIAASAYFATQLELDEKILSDLNPGIEVKSASIFEVSEELIEQGVWELKIDADKDIYIGFSSK